MKIGNNSARYRCCFYKATATSLISVEGSDNNCFCNKNVILQVNITRVQSWANYNLLVTLKILYNRSSGSRHYSTSLKVTRTTEHVKWYNYITKQRWKVSNVLVHQAQLDSVKCVFTKLNLTKLNLTVGKYSRDRLYWLFENFIANEYSTNHFGGCENNLLPLLNELILMKSQLLKTKFKHYTLYFNNISTL